MRRPPETITLGTQSWQIRPLTLAQVQAIEPLLFGPTDTQAASIATAIAIVRVALARDHTDAAADLELVEAGAPEVGAAMACVLRLGGFLPESPTPGEAGAGQGAPAA